MSSHAGVLSSQFDISSIIDCRFFCAGADVIFDCEKSKTQSLLTLTQRSSYILCNVESHILFISIGVLFDFNFSYDDQYKALLSVFISSIHFSTFFRTSTSSILPRSHSTADLLPFFADSYTCFIVSALVHVVLPNTPTQTSFVNQVAFDIHLYVYLGIKLNGSTLFAAFHILETLLANSAVFPASHKAPILHSLPEIDAPHDTSVVISDKTETGSSSSLRFSSCVFQYHFTYSTTAFAFASLLFMYSAIT
jgi:hypothetical protein